VETFVAPRISDAAARFEVFSEAHQSGAHLLLKGDARGRNIDFMTLSKYVDTDVDTMCILIFDFLAEHIFSGAAVYGDTAVTEALEFLQVFEGWILSDAEVPNRKFWE